MAPATATRSLTSVADTMTLPRAWTSARPMVATVVVSTLITRMLGATPAAPAPAIEMTMPSVRESAAARTSTSPSRARTVVSLATTSDATVSSAVWPMTATVSPNSRGSDRAGATAAAPAPATEMPMAMRSWWRPAATTTSLPPLLPLLSGPAVTVAPVAIRASVSIVWTATPIETGTAAAPAPPPATPAMAAWTDDTATTSTPRCVAVAGVADSVTSRTSSSSGTSTSSLPLGVGVAERALSHSSWCCSSLRGATAW
jgi:hypothetical protein